MKGFLSDNTSSVHPKVMEALMKANEGHAYPYGDDPYTLALETKIKEIIGPTALCTVVINGTGANVLGIASAIDGYHAVLTVDEAHINVDECGAFERFTGAKIVTVPHENGKLIPDKLNTHLGVLGNFHHNQPLVVSISQVTEYGSVYSINEMKAITAYAHSKGMLVHMDGARLANACVALDVSYKQMIADTGIDIISFGGTKNGLMYGELIITFDETLHQKLKFLRKQGMQLASKMRFISAQFIAYLEDDLSLEMAASANRMGKYLYEELKKFDDVDFLASVDANILFVKMQPDMVMELRKHQHFYVMDEAKGIIRLVTSFDTEKEDVDRFIHDLKVVLAKQDLLMD